jgi:drug/metabolite transporter (DMT)-like permease
MNVQTDQKAVIINWVLFVLLAITWGSSFILMKYGLLSFSYSQIGLLRISLAFWFMVLIGFRHFKQLRKQDMVPLIAVGMFGNAIPYMLFPLAVTELPSGLVGILNSLVPLFTLIIGLIWFKFKVGLPAIVGILLGLGGAIYLLSPDLSIKGANMTFGIYPILATICYGLSINIISSKLQHLDSISITLLSLLFVGLPATFVILAGDFVEIMNSDPQAWKSLGYVAILGVVGTSLAVIMFNQLIKKAGSLFSASVTYAIPLVALIWGVIDGEDLGTRHIIGMLAIIGGVYIINMRQRLRKLLQRIRA